MFNDIDKYKRINNGIHLSNTKVLEFDKETGRAVIQGSEDKPYVVTKDSCTCADFAITGGELCKHIYKVRSLLGIAPDMPKRNKVKEKEFKASIDAEVAKYEQLFFDGAITIERMVKITSALRGKNW